MLLPEVFGKLKSFIIWVTKGLKQTIVMIGSFKESKFKLTCCTGQGLITIEVVKQKLKKVENFDC